MTAARGFRQEQRRVALAMAGALATTIVVMGAAALLDRSGPATPFPSRLHFALRADAFVVLWLAAAIGNVARLRFFSEQDIAAGAATTGTDRVRIAGAVLQNTWEQVGLAVVTHLIVAAAFDASNALIAALVCLFAIGRLLFWAGYAQGASRRAFGFALTFYPSVVALLAAAVTVLRAWSA